MSAPDHDPPLWRRYLPQLAALAVGVLVIVGVRVLSDDGDATPSSTRDRGGGEDAPAGEGDTDGAGGDAAPADDGDGVDDDADEPAPQDDDERLLRVGDLPRGWAIAELTEDTDELCPGEDPTDEVEAADSARVAFRRGNEGPFLTHVVWDHRSADEAEDFLAAAADALEACATYQQGEQTFRVRRIALDDTGDEAVAATLTGTSLVGEVDGRVYYVRVGDRVTAVFALAQGRLDDAVALDALRTAVDRL